MFDVGGHAGGRACAVQVARSAASLNSFGSFVIQVNPNPNPNPSPNPNPNPNPDPNPNPNPNPDPKPNPNPNPNPTPNPDPVAYEAARVAWARLQAMDAPGGGAARRGGARANAH